MCTPRSFSQDDWEIKVPLMEMLRGSEMFASLLCVPMSITLVLSGCIAILFSDAQVVRLSAPVCSCVLTKLMEGPEWLKRYHLHIYKKLILYLQLRRSILKRDNLKKELFRLGTWRVV